MKTTSIEKTEKDFIASVDKKASELSEKLGNKVTPIVITIDDGSKVVGYFQEPKYDVLMYVTDCYIEKKLSLAAEATVKDSLIVEESDKRITSDLRKDAKIKASFTNAVLKLVAPFADEYKKK